MTQWQVGLTITAVKTKLSSQLMIGYQVEGKNDKYGNNFWRQIMKGEK